MKTNVCAPLHGSGGRELGAKSSVTDEGCGHVKVLKVGASFQQDIGALLLAETPHPSDVEPIRRNAEAGPRLFRAMQL